MADKKPKEDWQDAGGARPPTKGKYVALVRSRWNSDHPSREQYESQKRDLEEFAKTTPFVFGDVENPDDFIEGEEDTSALNRRFRLIREMMKEKK